MHRMLDESHLVASVMYMGIVQEYIVHETFCLIEHFYSLGHMPITWAVCSWSLSASAGFLLSLLSSLLMLACLFYAELN
jgi:hypothetical protein